MTTTADLLQSAKEQVQDLITRRKDEKAARVEQLRRISTSEEQATEVASAEAATDARSYIDSILG